MPKALVPTMALRLAILPRPVPGYDGSVCRDEPVLQQRFMKPDGGHIWTDVPVVKPEHLPDPTQDAVRQES